MCAINDLFGIKVIVSKSNEPSFYSFIVKINKCSGKIKVFNLMSRNNEIRYIEWHETCKCNLGASVCDNKQRIKINVNANVKNWIRRVCGW